MFFWLIIIIIFINNILVDVLDAFEKLFSFSWIDFIFFIILVIDGYVIFRKIIRNIFLFSNQLKFRLFINWLSLNFGSTANSSFRSIFTKWFWLAIASENYWFLKICFIVIFLRNLLICPLSFYWFSFFWKTPRSLIYYCIIFWSI